MGHSECDAILVGNGKVNAASALFAGDIDASLYMKRQSENRRRTAYKIADSRSYFEEAEAKIIEGFFEEYPKIPTILTNSIFV